MKKEFNLKKQMQSLLISNLYYLKYNRGLYKKSNFEKNYHKIIVDPDGKKRNLTLEKKYKLKQLKHITDFLNKANPGKILDVGCGHGWLLSSLNNKWKKFGVEISEYAAKSASNYGKIFNGELDQFTEKKFDFITALHVIEHHPNPEKLIKKIHRLLKPNGVLILETPDFDSAAARRYNKKFRLLKDKTHISLFSQDSLKRFVRDHNFKIFDLHYPYFETPFFNRKNILRIFNKNKISPPFYGSVITIFCKKN